MIAHAVPDSQAHGRLTISTTRFGAAEEVTTDVSHLYTFADALPGLPDSHRFALIDADEYAPLRWLQSLDDPLICLPLLPHTVLELDECAYGVQVAAAAGTSSNSGTTRPIHLVTRRVQADGTLVVNLMAPILLDSVSGTGRQVILQDQSYPVRQGIVWNPDSQKFGLLC